MTRRLLAAASVLALCAGTAQAETVLHILHTNDVHSRIEPINASDSTCGEEDIAAGACFGGIARIATKINELRDQITAEGGNVIVLDAGDQYQGTLFYTTYKGAEVVEFMSAIGYDAMAVGNHEFDDGPDGLAVLTDGVEFPLLSSNLDVSQSNILADKVAKHTVIEVGDTRIGIVAALAMDTPETSSPGPNVIFQDDADSLAAAAAELADQGVDKVIALTHVGYVRDLELAAEVPGIDAIIGGHSHTLLGDMEGAVDAYPTMVAGPDGTEVPVAQAYAYGKYLGHLTLTFDDAGVLVSAEGQPVLLDASVPEDEAIAARVAEMAEPIAALREEVVASTTAPIEGAREVCRAQECEMGNLVADAMLDRVAEQGITIAIQNGGGLRASIDAGDVTMGEVYTVLPFQNTLATFQLTGADIIAALENGASQYEEQAGRFAQVAGLQYTVDPSAEVGSRISEVMVEVEGEWVPIDEAATYGVATNNYMRGGGDGYDVFASNGQDAYDFGPDLAEVLADYLGAQDGGYTPYTDGRITVK
ncbi:multifunctional 2',3'-cyclic-nucleotide 2'-phosphodiesterase/5'-nucleotidase/3'-nucleotidase [Paracoccus liaowanqingii]|uniref:Multifunctional 2',3'-cyclic-nucleotide 2'-phosphodiesterase/5'-nucleotidase/3'-nucleotidase n=1 Tax=Paracoccus liaowanqingii TaxID=2560053 RepID=A0A4P7HJY9_9RHOB|nr:bifunctional metallophosphatase/5'-nucleotidase [Paracoccus liaowanqingii]QBX34416.1 multifunctional 2',3'-cyclic-nucleotide 2'-phosphodiesterase/5'-nucleotidase/3'-nucleotidase [Paracoccus liaowanqingii]